MKGKQVLSGEIHPSGYKNSVVALIPASVLFDKEVVLTNVPEITDVKKMVELLKKFGSGIVWDTKSRELRIDNKKLSLQNVDKADLGNMRGMTLFWGPMLARFGKINFKGLPGGCTLGLRPMDAHFMAFRDLGVKVKVTDTEVSMDASSALSKEIWLTEMSPTATENAVMLATALEGITKIVGAASEPQIQDLCRFLINSGAKIRGIGSSVLEVEGGRYLSPSRHEIISDHYEIATFLALGAATGGEVKVHNARPGQITNIINTFSKFGVEVGYEKDTAYVKGNQKFRIDCGTRGHAVIKAQPWPGLPVDTLPLFIPLALAAKSGQAIFHNWMYEAGLFWTSELAKMGANIIMGDPHRVVVTAGNKLRGAKMEAPYIIRAVVAIVMTAMIAEGESIILDADSLYRGHPRFAENLRKLGATIEVLEETSR